MFAEEVPGIGRVLKTLVQTASLPVFVRPIMYGLPKIGALQMFSQAIFKTLMEVLQNAILVTNSAQRTQNSCFE